MEPVPGGLYAAKDLTGVWRLVNITRGPDANGTVAADVLANVTVAGWAGNRSGENSTLVRGEVVAHYPHVFDTADFLRATPAPPTVTPTPMPKLFLPNMVKGLPEGEWLFANATLPSTPRPDGSTPPPKVFVLKAGEWPLEWDYVPPPPGGPSPAPAGYAQLVR